MKGIKMENTYSLSEYAKQFERMAFICGCKKCGAKMTSYVSSDEWLDIAYVLVEGDAITKKEFKKLHHLAVSQWELIKSTLEGVNS